MIIQHHHIQHAAEVVISPTPVIISSKTTDESSITSTITATPVEGPAEKAAASPPTTKRRGVVKSVSFNEGCNQSYDNAGTHHGLYSEDCKQFWYSPRDFQHFKLSSKNEARHFVNADVTFSQQANILADFAYPSVVFRAYAACCHWSPIDAADTTESDQDDDDENDVVNSYNDENDDDHDDDDRSSSSRQNNNSNNPVLTAEEEQELQKWMQVATSRLGLERHICSDYGTDRSLRRRQVVLIAMDVALDEEEDAARNGTVLDPNDKAELVKRACQEISRPSRLFAHIMALANYNANNNMYYYDNSSDWPLMQDWERPRTVHFFHAHHEPNRTNQHDSS